MRIDLNIPKGWHEIQGEKLVELAKLFLSHREKPDFLVRCFLLFSGWKVLRRPEMKIEGERHYWFSTGHPERSRRVKFYLGSDRFAYLVKKLEWITTGIHLPPEMPEISGYNHCNYKLYNVSLEDFLEADNFYNAYTQTNDSGFLSKLFSVFYTRKRWFARATKAEKYAVFLWFTGVKGYLVNKYPYIFSGNTSETGFPSPDETILNLLSALNMGNVTHNQQIFKTHVHECFYELNLKIEHAPKK